MESIENDSKEAHFNWKKFPLIMTQLKNNERLDWTLNKVEKSLQSATSEKLFAVVAHSDV